ncbi:MAG: 50S ribosomal protein L15 [Rhodospirillales bacterium]|nr:50S ribosomal protein L15 [Rhodospirillales bacterium]
MKLNQIRDNRGARQAPKRLGRGIGSGLGKTSGRGGKGQTARSGVSLNGFEGGQTPIYRRLPKRGFNNIFRRTFQELNLEILQKAIDDKKIDAAGPITADGLVKAGVIRRAFDGVRLLGNGKDAFKAKIEIEVAGATKSAVAAIEKAGGKVSFIAPVRENVLKDIAAKQARRAKRQAKETPKAAGKATEKPVEKAAEKSAGKAAEKPAK